MSETTPVAPAVEQVLVIPTAYFHQLGLFQGFVADHEKYLVPLLACPEMAYKPKPEMELDPSFKQLIPYVVFTRGQEVFAYYRAKTQGEQRLHGKRSIGVGGHICSLDGELTGDHTEAYYRALFRELNEEVYTDKSAGLSQPAAVGLINDDSNEVGKVHLGVVHVIDFEAVGNVYPLVANDMLDAAFVPLVELLLELDKFENWSQIVLTSPLFCRRLEISVRDKDGVQGGMVIPTPNTVPTTAIAQFDWAERFLKSQGRPTNGLQIQAPA